MDVKGIGGGMLEFFIDLGKTLLHTLVVTLKEAAKLAGTAFKGMRKMMK